MEKSRVFKTIPYNRKKKGKEVKKAIGKGLKVILFLLHMINVLLDALFFLILINPVSKIVVVSMLSKTLQKEESLRHLLIKSSLVAFALLVLFAFGGSIILKDIFQIDINALRSAGGIVLMIMGLRALDKGVFFQVEGNKSLMDLAIVPLASPMIAGPATITATIYKASLMSPLYISGAIMIALIINLFISLYSLKITKVLDRFNLTGALIRITGLFIMSIGMNMLLHGIQSFFIL